jgi:hypothetical protein
LFGVAPAAEMQGKSFLPLLHTDGEVRRGALFGYFGGAVNVTDGRYTYHRFPPDLRAQELYQYTLMPTHIWEPFTPEELAGASLAPPLPFSKGAPLLRVPVIARSPMFDNYGPGALLESETRLYDLASDPGQEKPLEDAEIEERMARLMRELMIANEAPPEAFARLGLEPVQA